MLAAVAVVLSLVERMFPLDAIVPVPGVKLGLANVVTLFALTRLSARDAFAIVVTRVAISSLLMGSVSALRFLLSLFSLFGGCRALGSIELHVPAGCHPARARRQIRTGERGDAVCAHAAERD